MAHRNHPLPVAAAHIRRTPMSHYPNPTHAHGPRGGHTYSIAHASIQPPPSFTSPSRRRVPFLAYTPTPGWKAVMGRAQRLHSAVSFDYYGQTRQGVSMRELRLKGTSTPIHGANDAVLAHTGLQRIVFRILVRTALSHRMRTISNPFTQWPGYGHVEWCRTIPVVAPNGAPITRVALAVQIASNFTRFFEVRSSFHPHPFSP
jgi:hypothetical protein